MEGDRSYAPEPPHANCCVSEEPFPEGRVWGSGSGSTEQEYDPFVSHLLSLPLPDSGSDDAPQEDPQKDSKQEKPDLDPPSTFDDTRLPETTPDRDDGDEEIERKGGKINVDGEGMSWASPKL